VRLLSQLTSQTLPPDVFETIVVDDGSTEPVATVLRSHTFPYALTVLRSEHVGAAAARHRGLQRAVGEIIVVVDDDVQIGPDFLARHLEMHPIGSRRAVLGWIRPDTTAAMPLFERFHADVLERFALEARTGSLQLQGTHLATGNVSIRRADYFSVGGFDVSLKHSEDAELGVRLQKAGVSLTFSDRARVIHSSDHASVSGWMRRAFVYGACDLQIARKHRDAPYADPWRYLWLVHPLSRPVLFVSVFSPSMMHVIALAAMRAAFAIEHIGAERFALIVTTVVYGIEYFRGVRHEAGSLGQAMADYRRYRRLRVRDSSLPVS
jgi:glycosyltransferase involved in cell wall biosynthesis